MPTGIDALGMSPVNRRACLQGLGWGGVGVVTALAPFATVPALAATALGQAGTVSAQRLAACWDDAKGAHRAGWLRVAGHRIEVQRSVELPTRGHGLALMPDGSLLVAARRPGDWLLRVPPKGAPDWVWMEAGRVFSGHMVPSGDGQTVFTTEVDTDTGNGLLGVRNARTLEKLAEWPTHGMDPHALSRMPAGTLGPGGAAHPLAGMLFVANGGMDTTLETGRTKRHLHRMNSSVACLHPQTGALLGQWWLDDLRLSLRHLAWGGTPDGQPLLGVALQAEHDEAAARAQAPLLAILDWQGNPGGELRLATGQPPLAGYGGDVAVLASPNAAEAQFIVSATRGHALARYTLNGEYIAQVAWPEAGALSKGASVWAGGRNGAVRPPWVERGAAPTACFGQGRLDNHWLTA